MNFRLKTLTAALLVALGAGNATAASVTAVLPSSAADRYVLKRDDGSILYWGHATYASKYLGYSGGCNDTPLGSSWCNWRALSTAQSSAVEGGLTNFGTITGATVAGVSATVERTVSEFNNGSADQGIVWYLSGGKLYAVKKSYTQNSAAFTSLIPATDSTVTAIAAVNAVDTVTDALVAGSGNNPSGVYFVTSTGDLYYYGKKPVLVQVASDVIANDTVAATTPVKLASGVSKLFASKNGSSTEGFKLGYVDTNGKAWVYQLATGTTPIDISTSRGIGTVSKVYTDNQGYNSVDTVLVSNNGVYIEMIGGASAQTLTATGFNGTGANAAFQQVPGLTAADVPNGVVFAGSNGNARLALFLNASGTVMGVGGSSSALNPLGVSAGSNSKQTLTPLAIALTDPAWKSTVTATKDTVANKVNLTITPSSGAAALHLYRATTSGGIGTKIEDLAGTATSSQDTPPDGKSYWYYVTADTADGKTGPQSAMVEGRANVAPTSVSASGTVVNAQAVTMTPTIVDPNTSDTFTVTVPTPPVHGTATVNESNQIIYTATNTNFAGTDTFQFRVADQMGNATQGNVSVTVTCAPPSITGQSQDPLVEWGQGTIQVNYTAQGCHSNLVGKLDLIDSVSGSTVLSDTTANLATGAGQTLNFVVKDLPAKNYTAKLTFQSDQLAATVSTLGNAVAVEGTSDPVLTLDKTTWSEDELATMTVTMPMDGNCPLTTDQTVAQANRSYCYAETTEIPLGLAQETVPGQLKVSGYGAPKTNTPFQYQVSKWDSQGNKRVIKSNIVTLSFLEAPAPTFEMFVAGTSVMAIKDLVATDLRQTSGVTCPVHTDQATAQADLAKGKRACLATFSTPDGAIMQYNAAANRFSGRFKGGVSGQQTFGYKVQRLYLDKPALGVAEGTLNFNVADFSNAPTFGVSLNKDKVVRNVDTVVATVPQLSGEPCTLTGNGNDAAASWFAEGMPKCLVAWGALPEGMSAAGVSASGKIASPGTFSVTANVSIINPSKGIELSVAAADKSVQAILPDGPPFAFDGTPILPNTNLYAVGDGGVIGKATLNEDSLGNVSMSIDTGGAAPEIHKGLKKGAIRNITVTPGALWSTKDVVVTALWEDFPDVKSTMTIRSVVLPPTGMQATMLLPKSIVSTLPVAVTVSLGLPNNTGLRFDAAKMGAWKGYLGAVQADGSVSRITEPVVIENGKATLTYPKAGDINNAQIVFVAEVQSGLDGYTNKLVSKPSKVTVVDGSGIIPTVHVDYASGAAPLRVKLKADIPSDQTKALGKSAWLISNDGGTTWAAIERANGTSINYTFKDPGKFKVKAKITNRFSGDFAYSEPVSIAAYALPALDVQGKTVVRVGAAASLKAISQATSIKWVVEKPDGTKQSIEGADLTLDSTMPQVIKATAYASNETDEALSDASAWAVEKTEVRFINLTPLKIALSGPKTLEVGQEGQYNALLKTDWDNTAAGFALKGQWALPDGTTSDGLSLKWSPTAEDFAAAKVPVFSAWVDGFAQQTTATASPKIALKKYVWPDWTLKTKYDVLQAPALIRLSVAAPTDQLKLFSSVNEKVKFTWALPDNAVGARATGGSAAFTAEMPGDYPVQVKMEDSRGNVKVLDYTITVTDPVPMEVDFKTTSSNIYNRVPLTLNLKPQFYKGHPKERITTFRFYQDGQLLGENNKGSYLTVIEQAGDYNLSVEADTTLGRTVKADKAITVVPNKTPVCKLANRAYKTTATVTAECKDPDGKIKSYAWRVDGQSVSTSGYRITVPNGSSVEVTVTDDSSETVTLNGST